MELNIMPIVKLLAVPPSYTWYDGRGREIANEYFGLNNKKIAIRTEYYSDGSVKRISEPFFIEDTFVPSVWAATYGYDGYGRNTSVETPMGITQTIYNGRTTRTETPSDVTTTTVNWAGQEESTQANGKTVAYEYYPSGLLKKSTPQDGQSIVFEYDLQGNRIKMTDPDAGVITSKYDGWGQLMWEKQAIHNSSLITTEYKYHPSGLLQYKLCNGEKTNYGYDNLYRLKWVSIAGQHAQGIVYDQYDRIIQRNDTVDGSKIFIRKTEYDPLGRINKEIYPTGYYTINQYDKYSILTSVKDRSGRLIWQALEENAKGQIKLEKKGREEIRREYDHRGFPTSLHAGIVDMSWSFDNKGNLSNRIDYFMNDQEERFAYDSQNRLTHWDLYDYNENLIKQSSINYNPTTGNISEKSDLGNLSFGYGGNNKPQHALTSISGVPAQFPTDNLSVTYTDFKKIKSLTQGNKTYTLTYGTDQQRRKSVYKINNTTQETRYYLGNYEEATNTSGVTKKIHYLSGGAMFITTGDTETLYYGYYDYLGSLVALANEQGQVVERYSYDPWGNRRNPNNWTQSDSRTSWIVNRGFTGHEHLDAFGIINMNGRVYDPLTAQFFSPDPHIQAPGNWLNYNRYSYAYNNPLKYTDPSGEFIFTLLAAIFCPPLAPAAAQLDMAWMQGGFMAKMNGGNFWSGAGKGAITGLMNAGLSFLNVPGMIPNGLLHAGGNVLSNGITNTMYGQDFFKGWGFQAMSGFAGGAYSGYKLSKTDGLNYWWGTKPAYNGGGTYRSQWSLAWWDRPDEIKFNSIPYNGEPVICDAMSMTTIDPRYTAEEWASIIERYESASDLGEKMVDYNQMYRDYGIQFFETGNVNMTGTEIQNIVDQGYNNLSLSVDEYYNIDGKGPDNHRMTVNKIKYVPNKYVKLYVSDWGWGRDTNGIVDYNMVYKLGKTKFNPFRYTFFK